MEFVILGLLMIRNLTQYEMRKALKQKISPFFSASLGSIQAALKKLESQEHIEINESVENGRKKKIFAINNLGKRYFMDWMISSIAPNRLEQDATTRLFFLGFMSSPERLAIVREIISQLETIVLDYEAASIEANQKATPEHLGHIVKFQLKTLDLGLFYHQSMLGWFQALYSELEENLSESR